MGIKEIITFEVMDLSTNLEVDDRYAIVVELFATTYDRVYLVKLPVLDYRLEKRLKHYKNIIN